MELNMPELDRKKKLEALAEQDDIFQVWKKTRAMYIDQFEAYANSQPKEVRNFLWGYASSTELMLQREIMLACLNMDFTEKTEE